MAGNPVARILVTREEAEPLVGLIRAGGAEPVHVPLVRLVGTGERPPPGRPDWALVTSATAVRFAPALASLLAGACVVAVGEATARALSNAGVAVYATGEGTGADAVRALAPEAGETTWYVGAAEPSEGLATALAAAPFRIARWFVYRNEVPPGVAAALVAALPVDVLAFASPSAVRAFAGCAVPGAAKVAVLGTTTAAAARAAGLTVDAVAAAPTMEALAAAALGLAP